MTATLTTVEKKIPDDSDLVKKSTLWCKNIRNRKNIYFTSSDYNN